MTGYSAKVVNSSKELSAVEKIALKDTGDCERLDALTSDGTVTIELDYYAEIAIHNEKSKDKDYSQIVVVAKDGTRFVTGSESFKTSLEDIYEEMYDAGEADNIVLKVYRVESKNYAGKQFIKCSLAL